MRRILSIAVLGLAVTAAGGSPLALGTDGTPPPEGAAATAPGSVNTAPDERVEKITLPEILKSADVERYRRIFALQKKARWSAADREIKLLSDRSLLGHVYFQRYMSRHYRSHYRELRRWLARYADHPGAKRIYKLALRRKPRRAHWPRRPVQVRLGGSVAVPYAAAYKPLPQPVLSRRQRRSARYLRHIIRRNIARGRLTRAARYLKRRRTQRLLGPVGYDNTRARLAFHFMIKGDAEKAYEMAKASADRSGQYLPFANWTAGLAAWRLGKYNEAATLFEAVAQADAVSPWVQSAGAYWAARAHLVGRKPENVNRWLDTAAQNARTFYGMLARRQLGLDTKFNWQISAKRGADMDRLLEAAPAVRAIALIQVGQTRLAEQELWRLYRGGDANLGAAVLAIAQAGKLAGVSLRVARLMINTDGRALDTGLYPIPHWEPGEGFRVDRALVYAVMRQESAFRTKAHSRVGARGLMQLMPRTASIVARDRTLRWRRGRNKLYNPSLNISLGQRYIVHLLSMDGIDGNLFYAVPSYNAGPLAVVKWQSTIDHRNDPLLFIESIPYTETRGYVERVIANLWAYRERLGQKAVSLEQVAKGEWPIYKPQDGIPTASKPAQQ
jgi:soluble lytic murein transglycosylase